MATDERGRERRPGAVTGRAIARRAVRFAVVLTRHGLGHLADVIRLRIAPIKRAQHRPGPDRSHAGAVHVRRAVEDLGPTFVKLGQLISTRADLLPTAYQNELARLQDAAPPEPPGTIDAVLEAELSLPVDVVFARFDPTPIAAASIGQAHAATLADGTEVVVKIRRPHAVATVEVDLAVIEGAAALVARLLPAARRLGVPAVVSELARTLRAELDYDVEAANAERFAADFAGNPAVHVPQVYRHASTGQVITLERVAGIKVSDLPALDAAGIDRPALARRIVDVVLSMVFEHGFFHADPHPGNLFVERDGRLGLVDFGMVGRLGPDTRTLLGRLFIATARADAAALTTQFLALGTATEPVDEAALSRDLASVLATVTGAPLGDFRIGPMLQAELAMVRRYRLRIPPDLALLVKTAAMTESLAAQLDPHFMILPAFAPYAGRMLDQDRTGSDGLAAGPPDTAA